MLDLAISSFLLDNGLRVVVVKDPKATEIQVTMRYQVGSVDDPPAQPGMAHLVEHLMYEPVLDGESLFARLEAATTFFNGITTFDATTFISRARPERLGELLAIEAARVEKRCAGITASAFAREQAVVVNEIRQREQASEALSAIHQALFPVNHPYRRSVGGSVESVTAITREQACSFANAHYAPNNAALVVAGNLTPAQEQSVFYQFVARSPKRTVVAPVPIHDVPFQPWYVAAAVPFDHDALLVAWPLPPQPQLRAKVRTLVAATAALVNQEIQGGATTIELGDTRSPMAGFVIFPELGETLDQARGGMERGVARLAGVIEQTDVAALGDVGFRRIRQTAIYRLHAALEDSDRDSQLASLILTGGDPRTVFGEELAGLTAFTPYEASYLARSFMTLPRAKVVVLQATTGPKRGSRVALGAPIHDLGRPRRTPDVAEAHRPAPQDLAGRGVAGMTSRRLRNGMRVVLLPSTSVPTVELRLVFGAGTADEPPDQRGVARLAAQALAWDVRDARDAQDLLEFAAAGGTKLVDVGADHTTFTAHGMAMDLHTLLMGLDTWIRGGIYDDGVGKTLAALQRERTRPDDTAALVETWRGALFGADHPYVRGEARYASAALTAAHAARFRAAHYNPANATLVVAGRFDRALADRWIDYWFADWEGGAGRPRTGVRAAARPIAIAKVDDLTQVRLLIALPATSGTRAEQLVAAELLAAIGSDVRHQLGASYDLSAALSEQRLATSYVLSGWIDAPRTSAAIQLLRDRIGKLRSDPDAAARAFVIARARVATRLASVSGSAEDLALRVEADISLDRPPLTDVQTALEVQRLTLARMTAVLGELDLARAAIAMRGPDAELRRAFAALGRKPDFVAGQPRRAAAPGPFGPVSGSRTK